VQHAVFTLTACESVAVQIHASDVPTFRSIRFPALVLATVLVAANASAVDKVYHPYVEPQKRDLEYRVTGYNGGDDNPDFQTHRLGFGYGVTNRIAVEGYLIGEKYGGNELALEAYELEMRWQLNEQGAAWLDSAMLFEMEHADDGSSSEIGTGFIAEKELDRRWSATANVIARYQFGDGVSDKLKGEAVAQARYRLSPSFEPALEAYWDDDMMAVGPAALGLVSLGGRNRLKWEAAALLAVEHDIADKVFRASLEWEF